MHGIPGYYLTPEDLEEFYERHAERRGPEKSQERIDYYIAYIGDIKSGKKGDPAERKLIALSAWARWALSVELEKASREPEAMDQIKTASAEVKPTQYYNVLYYCLKQAGKLCMYHDYEAAAAYFQRALAYTSPLLTGQTVTTLWYLAHTWARPETYECAILIFDWMLLMEPKNLATFCEKYGTMARYGNRSDVEHIADNGARNTCANCAVLVGTNFTLKRRDKTIEAARIGFQLARREERSKEWLREFGKVLKGVGQSASG